MPTCDAAIVGAGIVGAACAYELANAGLRVAVIDEAGVAEGATRAGMGHLVVMDDAPAQFALTRYSMEIWRSIFPLLPKNCEYWQCGTLWLAADEQELEFSARRGEAYNRNSVPAELIDAKCLAELEPNLRPGLAGGLLVPEDAAVYPPAVANFFIQQSRERGAELIANRAVRFSEDGVHLDNGTLLYAESMINAAGTAAPTLTPTLPVRPRKGHILVVDAGRNFARHQILETSYVKSTHTDQGDSVAFNVRHNAAGELMIGSSRQYDVTDLKIEPPIMRRMLQRAIEYMPEIANARSLRSWTGLRAATPDGLPLIGRCPGEPRIYAATGHEGLGATTSLGTARLLVHLILGQTPEIDPEPYNPARFESEKV